jgi:hypothetical protein
VFTSKPTSLLASNTASVLTIKNTKHKHHSDKSYILGTSTILYCQMHSPPLLEMIKYINDGEKIIRNISTSSLSNEISRNSNKYCKWKDKILIEIVPCSGI